MPTRRRRLGGQHFATAWRGLLAVPEASISACLWAADIRPVRHPKKSVFSTAAYTRRCHQRRSKRRKHGARPRRVSPSPFWELEALRPSLRRNRTKAMISSTILSASLTLRLLAKTRPTAVSLLRARTMATQSLHLEETQRREIKTEQASPCLRMSTPRSRLHPLDLSHSLSPTKTRPTRQTRIQISWVGRIRFIPRAHRRFRRFRGPQFRGIRRALLPRALCPCSHLSILAGPQYMSMRTSYYLARLRRIRHPLSRRRCRRCLQPPLLPALRQCPRLVRRMPSLLPTRLAGRHQRLQLRLHRDPRHLRQPREICRARLRDRRSHLQLL